MRPLTQARLGEPVLAAGAFRSVVDAPFGGLTPPAIGIPVMAAGWFRRKRSRLPTYPYLALTATELVVAEFRFGSSIRFKRLVGRWPLSSVQVLAAEPRRRRMTLRLGDKNPVELEGLYASASEREVVIRIHERPVNDH